jgi:hypothetical protein
MTHGPKTLVEEFWMAVTIPDPDAARAFMAPNAL